MQAFFLTSVAEKTKTQAQNSSQKLKEKTQPQGGTFFILRKTQEKKLDFTNFSLQTEIILSCVTFYAIFMNKKFKFYLFQIIFWQKHDIFRNLKKTWEENT